MSEHEKPIQVDEDYEVGYGKPPKHTRFKKGQSGNPKGRPRRLDFEEEKDPLRWHLFEQMPVVINGRKTKMPAIVLIFKSMIRKAIQGDLGSQKLIIGSIGGLTAIRKELERQNTQAVEEYLVRVKQMADEWLSQEPRTTTRNDDKQKHPARAGCFRERSNP